MPIPFRHPAAALSACDIDCSHYAKGRCPFSFSEKENCKRIENAAAAMYREFAKVPDPDKPIADLRTAAEAVASVLETLEPLKENASFAQIVGDLEAAQIHLTHSLSDLETSKPHAAALRAPSLFDGLEP